MNRECSQWLNNITWQVAFYNKSRKRLRHDPEFDWIWFERRNDEPLAKAKGLVRDALRALRLRPSNTLSVDWLHQNAAQLWNTRWMLVDELSKLIFDSALLVRIVDYRRYYFPRIDFEDLVDIVRTDPFTDEELPNNYLGLPLLLFDLRVNGQADISPLKMVTTESQLQLLNSYRQYIIHRNGIEMSPRAGDIVLDCGACIGEVSILFASLVGTQGQVHLFDPIPLHTRFCSYQAALNPSLSSVLHINALAVGAKSWVKAGDSHDLDSISPGNFRIEDFSSTTIDDYVSKHVARVDFIKMDIEGAELDALDGAANTIKRFRPRLAISGYHKPDDFWAIPNKIKSLNPNYVLTFGHHSPVSWESVFYAIDSAEMKQGSV